MGVDIDLIIGLGNPGPRYQLTRHNLGFMVVEHLVKVLGFQWKANPSLEGIIADGLWEGHTIHFFLPQTYMNESGRSVNKSITLNKTAIEKILVVCDDIHLDFGQMRLRRSGSDGGHHGLSSLIQHLGTEDFPRLRLGVGTPESMKNKEDTLVNFVLGNFDHREKAGLDQFIKKAADCCLLCLQEGIPKGMELYNKRETNE